MSPYDLVRSAAENFEAAKFNLINFGTCRNEGQTTARLGSIKRSC